MTSLALARWSWAVAGLLLGAALGWFVVSGGGYRGTAVLQIRSQASGTGPQKDSTPGIAALVSSDAVLKLAVTSMRGDGKWAASYARYGGHLPAPLPAAPGGQPDESPAMGYLASGLQATPKLGSTDLVEVSVTRVGSNGQIPALEANAVAEAVVTKIERDADDEITALTTELNSQLGKKDISTAVAAAMRERYATQVAQLALGDKQSLKSIPATKGTWAALDPRVSSLLGAVGGTFVGTLVAVAFGAGRHRPRSPRQLAALAPDLVVRTTAQAGELAGRLLETGRRTAVVLALPHAQFQAGQLAMAVAHHLRTHGATVAVVDRLTEGSDAVTGEERLRALRRDVRQDVPGTFAADLLVVGCPGDEEALSLIAGQSDLLVVVVGKRRASTLAGLRTVVDAVRISEPVVVLAP